MYKIFICNVRVAGESVSSSAGKQTTGSLTPDGDAGAAVDLPITLGVLVSHWDCFGYFLQKYMAPSGLIPSPGAVSLDKLHQMHRAEKQHVEKERKEVKGKIRKKEENVGVLRQAALVGLQQHRGNVGPANLRNMYRNNPFPALRQGQEAGEPPREGLCELCNVNFPQPVTYHMRTAHPGCGRHAGGCGYNSGGHYCGGWAGNCGDGGMAGSTWYLMCENCRTKYLRVSNRRARSA